MPATRHRVRSMLALASNTQKAKQPIKAVKGLSQRMRRQAPQNAADLRRDGPSLGPALSQPCADLGHTDGKGAVFRTLLPQGGELLFQVASPRLRRRKIGLANIERGAQRGNPSLMLTLCPGGFGAHPLQFRAEPVDFQGDFMEPAITRMDEGETRTGIPAGGGGAALGLIGAGSLRVADLLQPFRDGLPGQEHLRQGEAGFREAVPLCERLGELGVILGSPRLQLGVFSLQACQPGAHVGGRGKLEDV
jgi:hypothetical protein